MCAEKKAPTRASGRREVCPVEPIGNTLRAILGDLTPTITADEEPQGPACNVCLDSGWVMNRTAPRGDPNFLRQNRCTACSLLGARAQERVFRDAEIPERFRSYDLDTFPIENGTGPLVARLRAWSAAPAPESLLLYGAPGVGKTGLALGAARARAQEGTSFLFLTAADLLARFRATYDQQGEDDGPSEATVFGAAASVPLLVLDELGGQRTGEWATQTLSHLINRRHGALLPTIFTTGLMPADWERRFGRPFYERLYEMCQQGQGFVRVDGPNLRRKH
jgi:DNA replication protein DnaC